ncbi:hypothetical protein TDB9533_03081 [Thalassocella blandensis]|nr:hypothetical protein TDB9533_03081 [Thalassocella blandensis]
MRNILSRTLTISDLLQFFLPVQSLFLSATFLRYFYLYVLNQSSFKPLKRLAIHA